MSDLEAAPQPPPAVNETLYKGKCDVCNKKDGHMGHVLQRCDDCHVLVHDACYGLIPNMVKCVDTGKTKYDKRDHWKCWPCQLKHLQPDGKRATKCVLCSVSDGVHAMHPVYNKEGPDGKQMMRKSGPAWAHTLCGMFIGSHRKTAGCVFVCDENGDYSGDVEDNDEEEMSDKIESKSEAHHFVICGESNPGHAPWYKLIKNARNGFGYNIRCSTCNMKDSNKLVLRIPVQCCTGDEDEHGMFRDCHHPPGKTCHQAMHVGCARWKQPVKRRGSKDMSTTMNSVSRVFFWPGTALCDKDNSTATSTELEKLGFDDPVAEIYCHPCSKHLKTSWKEQRSHLPKTIKEQQKDCSTSIPTEDRINDDKQSNNSSGKTDILPSKKRKVVENIDSDSDDEVVLVRRRNVPSTVKKKKRNLIEDSDDDE
mmetsp:Transcript_1717/g.2566  ORF Transcript_1717/g.2566 Transcript_1717/m.2566 type:complete len:423 (+) Transcript_1717:70-1338(+)